MEANLEITLSQINRNHGTSHRDLKIDKQETLWAIGTLDEMLRKTIPKKYELKPGDWQIYYYYDHEWYTWGKMVDIDDDNDILTLERTTNNKYSDDTIGMIESEQLKKLRKEFRETEIEDMLQGDAAYDGRSEFVSSIVEKESNKIQITNGRGSDDWNLYLRKDKKDRIVAYALISEYFFKYN